MTKHQPAGAFTTTLIKAPDTDTHPVAPKPVNTEPKNEPGVNAVQFSARIDPELLRQVKIRVASQGTTLQAVAAEAFRLWLTT
jgi:hypothetical protein